MKTLTTAITVTATLALVLGMSSVVLVANAAGHAREAARATRMTVSQTTSPSGTPVAVITITGKRMTAAQKLAFDIRDKALHVAQTKSSNKAQG